MRFKRRSLSAYKLYKIPEDCCWPNTDIKCVLSVETADDNHCWRYDEVTTYKLSGKGDTKDIKQNLPRNALRRH